MAPVLVLASAYYTKLPARCFFQIPVLFLLLLMPCMWGKCIFDEVQSSVRVLPPPDNRLSPSDDVKLDVSANKQEDWLTHVQVQNHQNAVSQYYSSQRSKRMTRDRIKVNDKPQPIRIKTWTPRESPVLLPWETERLKAAVSDAISTVSKLLAGIVSVCFNLKAKKILHLLPIKAISHGKLHV